MYSEVRCKPYSGVPSRMLSLIPILAVPYLAFILISQQINPWSKPKCIPTRFLWRLARRVAVILFLGGLANLVFYKHYDWPQLDSIVIATILMLPFLLFVVVIAYRNKQHYQ